MTFLPIATAEPQVAMAIGRRFGNAVERNRGRRRIRAAFRQSWDPNRVPAGAFLITAGPAVLSLPFEALVAATEGCLNQVASQSEATTAAQANQSVRAGCSV